MYEEHYNMHCTNSSTHTLPISHGYVYFLIYTVQTVTISTIHKYQYVSFIQSLCSKKRDLIYLLRLFSTGKRDVLIYTAHFILSQQGPDITKRT